MSHLPDMAPGAAVGRRSLLVIAAAALVWFALLGQRDLLDPDEGRYAEIPREMVASGDWLTPRLQGLKYFEKPALQYWATAISFELFGENNVSARLWVVLLGFAGALWTGFLGLKLFDRRVGRLAFLITGSGLLYFTMGHLLTLDMSLTFFLTLALGSLALAQQARERPKVLRAWMLLAWAALAGAVLSKGLVGLVLPAAAVGLYMLWLHDWRLLKDLHLGKGLLLLVLLCAPWFLAVSRANPEFAQFFFVHEHFERFTTDQHGRGGPIFYFVVIGLVGALPWTLLTLRALFRPAFAPNGDGVFQSARLFWIYVLFVLLFFSVSHSKLPAYILPIFPFAALLAARKAVALGRWRCDGWALLGWAAVLAAVTSQSFRFASRSTPAELIAGMEPWGYAAAAGFAAAGSILLLRRGTLEGRMTAAALMAMLSTQMLLVGSQALAPSRSGREFAQAVERLSLPADTPLYLVGDYSPSFAFYAKRVPTIVGYRGELEFGMRVEPGRVIEDKAEFAARWRNERQAIAVIDNGRRGRLDPDLPMDVIESSPRRTLVVRDAAALPGAAGRGG
ncbi:MAG: phospholipid carrier-dependent glycosyltransferase [Pseudomonadales bacterium]